MGALSCAACGRPYGGQRIRVLAQRDSLYFVDLACRDCGSEAVAIISVETEDGGRARVQLGELGEGAPVSAMDVLDMHRFLAGFDGDFQRLFGPGGTDAAGMTGA